MRIERSYLGDNMPDCSDLLQPNVRLEDTLSSLNVPSGNNNELRLWNLAEDNQQFNDRLSQDEGRSVEFSTLPVDLARIKLQSCLVKYI